MLIFPLALGGGLLAGYAGGGRLRGLGRLRFRASPLLLGALVAQLLLPVLAGPPRTALMVGSYALVGIWLAINLVGRSRVLQVAIALLALGWVLNAVPVAANGGMPVSSTALRAAGVPPVEQAVAGNIDKHVAAGGHSRFAALGDVIPIRPLRAVVSAGDIALFGGLVLIVAAGMAAARPGALPVSREEIE